MRAFKEVNHSQGGEDWLLWRRTHITATDSAKVCGVSKYGAPIDVYEEKIEGKTKPITAAMIRGSELEEQARFLLCLKTGMDLKPKCFESTKYSFMSCSLDAIDEENKVIYEIKCPSERRYLEFKEDSMKIPMDYIYQCHKDMIIMEIDVMTLFFYLNEFEHFEYEVIKDEKIVNNIIEKETNFWYNNLLALKKPSKINLPLNSDITQNKLALELKEVNSSIAKLQERKNEIEDKLKEKLGKNSSFLEKAGLKYEITQRKGAISWTTIADEFNIPKDFIESKRSSPVTYCKFTFID